MSIKALSPNCASNPKLESIDWPPQKTESIGEQKTQFVYLSKCNELMKIFETALGTSHKPYDSGLDPLLAPFQKCLGKLQNFTDNPPGLLEGSLDTCLQAGTKLAQSLTLSSQAKGSSNLDKWQMHAELQDLSKLVEKLFIEHAIQTAGYQKRLLEDDAEIENLKSSVEKAQKKSAFVIKDMTHIIQNQETALEASSGKIRETSLELTQAKEAVEGLKQENHTILQQLSIVKDIDAVKSEAICRLESQIQSLKEQMSLALLKKEEEIEQVRNQLNKIQNEESHKDFTIQELSEENGALQKDIEALEKQLMQEAQADAEFDQMDDAIAELQNQMR